MDKNSIYKLKLHESTIIQHDNKIPNPTITTVITRVPGGWIYASFILDVVKKESFVTSTFVPKSTEFTFKE